MTECRHRWAVEAQAGSVSAAAGLSLRLFLLLQDKLAEVSEDISDQPALVLGRGHQNQVSKYFGDLECNFAKVDLLILQMALQEVMDLAMNAIGHLNSQPDQSR